MDEKMIQEFAGNVKVWREQVAEKLQQLRGEPIDPDFDDLLHKVIETWLQRHPEWQQSIGKLKGQGILDVLDAMIESKETERS